jgi:type IV pilus assembly protein PilZ
MTDNSIPEKRQHFRAPIELKVEYKKLNTFFADYTKNISKGGTFIKTERPLPIGTEFLFQLVIPRLTQPVSIRGVVVWINEPNKPSQHQQKEPGMGIQFIYNDDRQRSEFEHMVEGMMRESLGDHLYARLLGK